MRCSRQKSILLAAAVALSVAAPIKDARVFAENAMPTIGGRDGKLPAVDRRHRRPGGLARTGAKHRLNPVSQVDVGPPSVATTNVVPTPNGPDPPCCKQ